MSRSLRPALSAPAFVFALILCTLLPSSARAVEIFVNIGGAFTAFDVVFFQGPQTFDSNAATIQEAPWWGSQGLALDFAQAYEAQVGTSTFAVLPGNGNDFLLFAYSLTAPNDVNTIALPDAGFIDSRTEDTRNAITAINFAYIAAAAPVPEIDGGALGQGAVILLAVWLMLRRRAGAGLRRVAVRPRG